MDSGLISIIIPVYNRANLIVETLDSIKSQSYTNWECILVDDHSTDTTVEVIKKYLEEDTRFTLFIRPNSKPKGANACRNYGFELAKGDYIQWFDSDDIMHKDNLKLKIKAIKNQDFVFSNIAFFSKDKDNAKPHNHLVTKNVLEDYILGSLVLLTQSSLWKRSAVQKFSFNSKLRRAQELDFFSRVLLQKKLKNLYLPEALVLIRKHENSITGNYFKGNKAQLKDDAWVKQYIWFRAKNMSKQTQNKLYGIYLKTLRKLLQFGHKRAALQSIFNSVLKGKNKRNSIKFLIFTFIFSVSGKGSMVLKRNSEKFINN